MLACLAPSRDALSKLCLSSSHAMRRVGTPAGVTDDDRSTSGTVTQSAVLRARLAVLYKVVYETVQTSHDLLRRCSRDPGQGTADGFPRALITRRTPAVGPGLQRVLPYCLVQVKRARLAEVHRRLGEAEQGAGRRTLNQADWVPDPRRCARGPA
jgi:hypothetical protein